jgi:hypothetical protein
MIEDFTDALLAYASPYTVLSIEKIKYNGQVYDGAATSRTVNGILQPLGSEEIKPVLDLGYTTVGTKSFYMPVSEGVLIAGDELVDTDGRRWKVLPELFDYADLGGFIKYIVHREMV